MNLMTKTLLAIIVNLFFFQTNAQVLGSLNFNGNDSYAEIINNPLNEIDEGNFTFEAWVKGEESEQISHPMIFSNRGNNALDGGILFYFHDQWGGSQSKLLCVQIDESNYKFVDNGSFNGSLLDNECHHVAITRNGNTLTFFGDGILIGTTSPSNLGSISSNSSLWIGKDKPTNNTFNGIISQCRIWNIARTQSEINQSKDVSLQGDEIGLLAYWEMNNENGQILSDKTGQFSGVLGSSDQIDSQDPLWSEEGCVQDSTVSTNDNIKSIFKVTPNPTSDFITIKYEGSENIQIRLVDQSGKLLLSQTVSPQTTNIDIRDYPKGLYFLSVNYSNKIFTQKLIKL